MLWVAVVVPMVGVAMMITPSVVAMVAPVVVVARRLWGGVSQVFYPSQDRVDLVLECQLQRRAGDPKLQLLLPIPIPKYKYRLFLSYRVTILRWGEVVRL